MITSRQFKVAAVQASPVFLDKKTTVDKACKLIYEAGKNGAKLAVFPEAFIPAYPDWVWVVKPYEAKLLNKYYSLLLENSLTIPGEEVKKLCAAAKKAKIFVVMGLNERNSEKSNSSLYNTILYISDEGEILGRHRKLVPTSAERLVWAQGDGSDLEAYSTGIGNLGGLICWENYMPLARYAVYSFGTQIYAAPTWDQGAVWLDSMKHIAKEGGVYVISCCMAIEFNSLPDDLKIQYPPKDKWLAAGNSAIINPKGELIAGPLKMKEEILYADADLDIISSVKRTLDVTGHYDRPDVFKFEIKK
jgi:nitrilase